MYFIQADSHLWSHKTNYKELSKLGDWHFKDNMHSKAAYQSVSSCMANLLYIMPEFIHLFTPWPLRFTLWEADFSGFFKCMNNQHQCCVPCPAIGSALVMSLTQFFDTKKPSVYMLKSNAELKFHRPHLPLSHPGHGGYRADYKLLCVSV